MAIKVVPLTEKSIDKAKEIHREKATHKDHVLSDGDGLQLRA